MSVRVIDGASDSDRARCIHALVLAFVRDPMMRWLYPDPEAYLTHFPGFARAFGGPAFESGAAWLSDDLGGAALWLPSSVHPDGEAIEGHLRTTAAPSALEVLDATLESMDAHHPEEPHWYLAIIGVDAAHQGKGLGARLLEDALARCDAEGLPAYLESSNPANVSLYERHGFRVTGEIRHGDAPPMIPMVREAR